MNIAKGIEPDGDAVYLRCDKEGKVFLSHEDINKIAAVTARLVMISLKQVDKVT